MLCYLHCSTYLHTPVSSLHPSSSNCCPWLQQWVQLRSALSIPGSSLSITVLRGGKNTTFLMFAYTEFQPSLQREFSIVTQSKDFFSEHDLLFVKPLTHPDHWLWNMAKNIAYFQHSMQNGKYLPTRRSASAHHFLILFKRQPCARLLFQSLKQLQFARVMAPNIKCELIVALRPWFEWLIIKRFLLFQVRILPWAEFSISQHKEL